MEPDDPVLAFPCPGVEVNASADLARIEFNLYLRFITTPSSLRSHCLFTFGMAADGTSASGLLRDVGQLGDRHASFLTGARDILRGNMLARELWRMALSVHRHLLVLCGRSASIKVDASGPSCLAYSRFLCSSPPPGPG